MLALHYDPAYDRSMKRNYLRIDDAPVVTLDGADPAAVADAARRILARCSGPDAASPALSDSPP